MKLGKFGSQKNTDNIEEESDERNQMNTIDDERYKIRESKEDYLESEESEPDEIYQIEKPESLKSIDIP